MSTGVVSRTRHECVGSHPTRVGRRPGVGWKEFFGVLCLYFALVGIEESSRSGPLWGNPISPPVRSNVRLSSKTVTGGLC